MSERPRYLTLAKHSFSRSSSERTCDSMAPCSATVPLLNNSPEAFLSKFSLQSRIACLVSLWACATAFTYVCMQVSADEHVWHSCAAARSETSRAGPETSRASVTARTFIGLSPANSVVHRVGRVWVPILNNRDAVTTCRFETLVLRRPRQAANPIIVPSSHDQLRFVSGYHP